MKNIRINNRINQGGLALVSVIITMAIALVLATAAIIVAIIESQATLAQQESVKTFAVADACAEEGVLRVIRDPSNYTGQTGLSVGTGSCTIVVTISGTTRTIDVTANIGSTYFRKIRVGSTYTGGKLTINSWREVE